MFTVRSGGERVVEHTRADAADAEGSAGVTSARLASVCLAILSLDAGAGGAGLASARPAFSHCRVWVKKEKREKGAGGGGVSVDE